MKVKRKKKMEKSENKTNKFRFREESPELANLIKEYSTLKAVVDLELPEGDWSTRPGIEVMKNQAKERIKDFRQQYFKEFGKTVVKVFLNATREQTESFVKHLNREIDTIGVPDYYEDIVSIVEPSLGYGREFSSGAYVKTLDAARTISSNFGVYADTAPQPPAPHVTKTAEELKETIKGIVRKSFGDKLTRSYIINTSVDEALAGGKKNKINVLVIPNTTQDEREELMLTTFEKSSSIFIELPPDDPAERSTALKCCRLVYEAVTGKRGGKKDVVEVELDVDVEETQQEQVK